MLIYGKRLCIFSGLQINIYKRVMKLIFFLTIGPTSFVDLPKKKKIKSSKVQTKNYFKLNLIELFF